MKSKNLLTTSVTAGKYKGKKIFLPSLSTTRSTKSILKSSFFDRVQFDIRGRDFFEVFGGSGSMGLEALSRGAKRAFFIEVDKRAYDILTKNCKNIDPNSTTAILGDSFEEYGKVLEILDESSFIYLDPPFDIREGMGEIYDKVISLIEKTPKNRASLIAIEHISSLKLPKEIGEFSLDKSKKFGKSSITYYQ
jgi:16S rRNA (guanine(966)-N(2))-methyltransferase RsmD